MANAYEATGDMDAAIYRKMSQQISGQKSRNRLEQVNTNSQDISGKKDCTRKPSMNLKDYCKTVNNSPKTKHF